MDSFNHYPSTTESTNNFKNGGNLIGKVEVTGTGNTIYINAAQFVKIPEVRNYLRMLVVLVNPVASRDGRGLPESRPLDIWGEWERLYYATNRARDVVTGIGAPWAVVRLVPPTAQELRDALIQRDPGYQVLHFSCHGTPNGLILEDELGREQLLTMADFVDAVRGGKRSSAVRLVVLNACDTVDLGRALVEQAGVKCVIATRKPIYDSEAAVLTERLYRRLALGETVGSALDEARRTIVERINNGELVIAGDPQERFDNLVLIGDRNVRLKPNGKAATESCFIFYPVPYYDLPSPNFLFFGRIAEQQTLARWFKHPGRRVFVISGIGGVGKTALALNVALRQAYRFRFLVWVKAKSGVDFGAFQVLQAINNALNRSTEPDEEKNIQSAIIHRLNNYSILLILDNMERVSPNRAGVLARTLSEFDPRYGSRVLITLRSEENDQFTALARGDFLILRGLDQASALRLTWEEILLQKIELDPQSYGHPIDSAYAFELRQLSNAIHLPKQLVSAEIAALDELSRLAFKHPALIKHAVTMIRNHDWWGTYRRLEQLKGQDIEEVLAHIIGQVLEDVLKRAPQCLNVLHASLVFAGGAQEACLRTTVLGQKISDDSDEAFDFQDQLLRPLTRAFLLIHEGNHYNLEEPIRAYLEHKCPPSDEALSRYMYHHAESHVAIVEQYSVALKESRMTYSAPLEWSNVTAALDRLAQKAPRDDQWAKLLLVYTRGLHSILSNNYDPRRRRWLDIANLAAEHVGNEWDQAGILRLIGTIQQLRGEYTIALASYETSLTLYRVLSSKLGYANVLFKIGEVEYSMAHYEKALLSHESTLALYREAGVQLGEANTLAAIGNTKRARGELEEALSSYTSALMIFETLGEKLGQASIYKSIGHVQYSRGNRDEARDHFTKALEIYRMIGSQLGEANVLSAIGDLQISCKQFRESLKNYHDALKLYQSIGSQISEASVCKSIGEAHENLDEKKTALIYYEKARDIFRQLRVRLNEAHTHRAIGNILKSSNRLVKALECYQAAMTIYHALNQEIDEAHVRKSIGDILSSRNKKRAALKSYDAALNIYRSNNYHWGEAHTLQAIGDVNISQAESDAALEKYSAALLLHQKTDHRECTARMLRKIGNIRVSRKELEYALKNYKSAIDIYRDMNDDWNVASVLFSIGDVHKSQIRLRSALKSYESSLEIYKKLEQALNETIDNKANDVSLIENDDSMIKVEVIAENQLKNAHIIQSTIKSNDYGQGSAINSSYLLYIQSQQARLLSSIGNVLERRCETKKALRFFEAALSLYRTIGDMWEEAHLLQVMGGVQRSHKQYNAALISYEAALELHRKTKHQKCEAWVLEAIGHVKQSLHQNNESIEYYDAAIDLYRIIGNIRGEASVMMGKSLILIDNNPIESQILFHQAQELRRKINDAYGLGNDLCNYGVALLHRRHKEEARDYFSQARKIFERYDLQSYVRQVDTLIALTEGWRSRYTYTKTLVQQWMEAWESRDEPFLVEEFETFRRRWQLSWFFRQLFRWM